MGGEWRQVSLADAVEVVSGGTPKTTDVKYWNGTIPWLSVADFNKGYRWVSAAEKHITEKGLSESATTMLHRGDIIISARGTVGALAQLAKPMAFNQSCYGLRGKPGIAENDYLFYLLHQAVSEMKQVAHGGVFDTITRDTFKILQVALPPLPEQRAIAHILGTLDDKIELNRRMNETLEAMARALFKSWFVDFDPVRAKIEGRWRKGESLPGLPAELWDVFPNRLVDSELGEIPEGWEVGCLGSICEVIDCLHTKKPERAEEGRPLLQLCNIRNDGLLDMSDTYWIDEADYEKWIARIEASPGDCVITNVGRVGAVAQIPHGFKAALGRNMTGLRCRRDFIFPTFLIECLLSDSMSEEIRLRIDSGTILDSLNVRSIPYLRFVLATSNTLQSFEKLARPFRQRMEKCLELSFSLSSLRDTLLPKLISGEIRVREAESLGSGLL